MPDGILIIDKPAGITSHDVVARLRRILQTKKIGHTGTLDPFATGVLVMLVGRATRLAQFLDKDSKEYEAVVRFGFETETGDQTGLRIADCGLRIEQLAETLEKTCWDDVFEEFRGEIKQMPPMYSAKKVKGKKLYELARQGIEIEREPIRVKIYELALSDKSEIRNPKSEIGLRVLCSAGTYIRTLAEDIGRKIGVGAHLAALRRTRAGNFDISRAATLEQLQLIAEENKLEDALVSMNEAVGHLAERKLSENELDKIKNGQKVRAELPAEKTGQNIRLTDPNGDLAAIGIYNQTENQIQPRIVFIN